MTTVLRDDIDSAVQRMSIRTGARREIKRLSDHLIEGEKVALLAVGYLDGHGAGLVALTDLRLMFIKDGWLKAVIRNYPLSTVTGVQWVQGRLMGTMTVDVGGDRVAFTEMALHDGRVMADAMAYRTLERNRVV